VAQANLPARWRWPAALAPLAESGDEQCLRHEQAPAPAARALPALPPITTRWMDNDVYGHVNNVVYYSFFDTAVNRYLIEQGALDIHQAR
jgi:acyl-CoA thioester hydrolase